MTSEARDISLDQGKPYKLYRFTRSTVSWYHTDADRPIVYLGNIYLPVPISHTEIQDGSETNQASITITLPKTAAVAANWRPEPPCDAVSVTILTQHFGESDYLANWVGRIVGAQFTDTNLVLTTEPTLTTAKRAGGGRTWQRPCDLLLYSQGNGRCNVDKTLHALPFTLSGVSGFSLTADAFGTLPSGRLAGGWIEWTRPSDGLTLRRSIDSHGGNTITVTFGGAELIDGLEGTAYPGCGQDWDDCTYYNNTDNYGGELWMPGRNYYDGNPVS
ncbi:phage BR0599 family protein [Rhodanobacter sp. BL-MT-08]